MRGLGVVVLFAGLLCAAPAQAFPVMSCWNGTGQDWLEHPSRCTHSTDGSSARTASFVGLRWSRWGKRTATATGRQTANHRRRDGTLPRYRTTVQVRRLTHCGDTATYYQEIRFKTAWPKTKARYSRWLPLTVPRC